MEPGNTGELLERRELLGAFGRLRQQRYRLRGVGPVQRSNRIRPSSWRERPARRGDAPRAIARTGRFEAYVTLAADKQDRVWMAWHESGINWGKDWGYPFDIRANATGLYNSRNIRMAVYDRGQLRAPARSLESSLPDPGPGNNFYEYPQLAVDGGNRVWALFRHRAADAAQRVLAHPVAPRTVGNLRQLLRRRRVVASGAAAVLDRPHRHAGRSPGRLLRPAGGRVPHRPAQFPRLRQHDARRLRRAATLPRGLGCRAPAGPVPASAGGGCAAAAEPAPARHGRRRTSPPQRRAGRGAHPELCLRSRRQALQDLPWRHAPPHRDLVGWLQRRLD